jgi:hypothetical protein
MRPAGVMTPYLVKSRMSYYHIPVSVRREGIWSSGKHVGTICLRPAGSSPAPPAVWVFWRLILVGQGFDPALHFRRQNSFPETWSSADPQDWMVIILQPTSVVLV